MAEHKDKDTVVRVPKSLKEAAIKAVYDQTGFNPVFEDFVHAAIRHETDRFRQKRLPPTGSD